MTRDEFLEWLEQHTNAMATRTGVTEALDALLAATRREALAEAARTAEARRLRSDWPRHCPTLRDAAEAIRAIAVPK